MAEILRNYANVILKQDLFNYNSTKLISLHIKLWHLIVCFSLNMLHLHT